MRKKWLQILVANLLLCGLVAVSLPAAAQAESFSNPAFQTTWNRTDGPVAAGTVDRPYFWGKEPFATKTERYASSPQQRRQVEYYDKGRMEITYPDADSSNSWYVTSGLLVRDLAAGVVQTGDNQALSFEPAEIPIVGDEESPLSTTPFYSDFRFTVTGGRTTRSRVGLTITTTIRRGGFTGTRSSSAQPKVIVNYYEPTAGHNIAKPFWDFMNAVGPVNTPSGKTVTGPVFEWQYILGYPITEPLWTTAKFNGKNQEVLIQLFQRRVLIYNPTAPEGSKVDFNNVGRHWYNWAYSPAPVYQGDTSVPASVNGQIQPTYGNINTLFSFSAPGYRPGEKISPTVYWPDGDVLDERDLGPLQADQQGVVRASFYGGSLATDTNKGVGVYQLALKGKDSGKTSQIYWRIIDHIPLTPTTAYNPDTSPPPASKGAIVEPTVGPRGTNFIAFIFDFQVKEIFQNKIAIWVTSPQGQVYGVNPLLFLDSAEEALDGMTVGLGSPPSPGIWAITFAYKAKPSKQAIVYLKVTEAPPELTLGAALRVYTLGSSSDHKLQLWSQNLKWQDRIPAAQPVPEPEGGEE
jgi:hypothetical protein